MLPVEAFRGILERLPGGPVTLRVLGHTLSGHLSWGQTPTSVWALSHPVQAHTVLVACLGAGEGLVALGAVLRLVADDDFLAVSACPVHGTYPSTPQTPRQNFTVGPKQALTALDPT